MTSRTGTYFKDIYTDLVSRLPEFPTDDPSPNLQECVKPDYVNFVRAEMLARQHNLPLDILTPLRELVILQYMWDYDNFIGFEKLIQEYKITPTERVRIVLLSLKEKIYPCFSFSENTLDEGRAVQYAPEARRLIPVTEKRKGIVSKVIAWIKKLFGRNKLPKK